MRRHKPTRQLRLPFAFFQLEVIVLDKIKGLISALFHTQTRLSWRRIAVLILGTGLLMISVLNSDQWLYLALAYIAGDSAEKAMAAFSNRG